MEPTQIPENQETQKDFNPRYILSVLFYLAEPVSFKQLASVCGVSTETIQDSLEMLKSLAEDAGLSLVVHDGQVQMTTHKDAHIYIEKIKKEEIAKELSKASIETLSIILYKDTVSRADIDFIRGVNSSFILRNLLIRGLIIRAVHPSDSRTFVYTASHDLLSYLGVSETKDLPDHTRIQGLLQEKIQGLETLEKDL